MTIEKGKRYPKRPKHTTALKKGSKGERRESKAGFRGGNLQFRFLKIDSKNYFLHQQKNFWYYSHFVAGNNKIFCKMKITQIMNERPEDTTVTMVILWLLQSPCSHYFGQQP